MVRFILMAFFLQSYSKFVQAEILTGIAKNQQGNIVYIEKHDITKNQEGLNEYIRVEYSKPDGIVFATMTSNFSENKLVPDTTFEDRRFKSKITLRVINSTVEFEESSGSQIIAKSVLPLKDSMVAVQGFDNFVKMKGRQLASQNLDFKFGVLVEKDFFNLTGYKGESRDPSEIAFGIRASNWLIRMFVGELKVIYETQTLRLKSYEGKSNIVDDSGKSQDVVINYHWSRGK